jgi:IclR family mhp operon transcriptional activator
MKRRTKSQGILRTLEVLRVLNTHNRATVTELSAVTKISRPALYRILDVLLMGGYVLRNERGGYELTHLVRQLSDGFKDEDWIAEAAVPALDALQRRVMWPTDLGLYSNYALYLRTTTRRSSPLVIDRGSVGFRLPLLGTAMGLAYISFCPPGEREEILGALRKSDWPYDEVARNQKRVTQLIAKTQNDGYGSRYREIVHETGSIAVPIRFEDRVHASIGITFFAATFTPAEAAAKYLDDLKAAAQEIEQRLREIRAA